MCIKNIQAKQAEIADGAALNVSPIHFLEVVQKAVETDSIAAISAFAQETYGDTLKKCRRALIKDKDLSSLLNSCLTEQTPVEQKVAALMNGAAQAVSASQKGQEQLEQQIQHGQVENI